MKTHKFLKYLFLIVLVSSTASCSNWLEEEPPTFFPTIDEHVLVF